MEQELFWQKYFNLYIHHHQPVCSSTFYSSFSFFLLRKFPSQINVNCKASFYYNFLEIFFLDPILGPTSFQAAVTNEAKTRQDELNSSSSSGEADPNNSNQTVIPANNDSIRSASELEVSSLSQLSKNIVGDSRRKKRIGC